jgi:ATP-dependent DNA ligase
MPQPSLFGEPASPPLVEGPVALMRLVEIEDISELLQDMRRMHLGPEDFSAETKFNGWLVQAAGGRLWSRRGNVELTQKFPEIAAAIAPYVADHLIGELVYLSPEGIMIEPVVTSVAMTKDPREAVAKLRALPGRFEYILFDALALRGLQTAQYETWVRQTLLLESVAQQGPLRVAPVFPFEEWERIYEAGVAAGGDGVVLKNRRAPYTWRPLGEPEPRPVGRWYKLKPALTDDFVVYETGRGPKGRLLMVFGQFHQGVLVPVGSVSNLPKSEEAEVLELMARGPFVVELEFQARFPDPPGALQSPRFLRFRPEKRLEDAILPERFAP